MNRINKACPPRFARPHLLLPAVLFGSAAAAVLPPEFEVIARTGDTVTDGSGLTLDYAYNPSIDDNGRMLFIASTWGFVTGYAEALMVEYDPADGGLRPLLRTGDSLPDGTTLADPFYYTDQRLGHTADGTFLGLTWILDADGFPEPALIREGPSGLEFAARIGQQAPDGNGIFTDFTRAWFYDYRPFFAPGGYLLFEATTADGSNTVSRGVFRSGPGGLEVLARHRQPSPDATGKLSYPTLIAAGGRGSAVIGSDFVGGGGGFGLLTYADGALQVLLREGDPLPGGASLAWYGYLADINSAGETAFTASVYDVSGNTFDRLYFHDGAAIAEVVRPDASTQSAAVDDLDLNNNGTLVFSYRDVSGNTVIAARASDGTVRQVWSSKDDGFSYHYTEVEINDAGDIFAYSYSGGWLLFFDSEGFKYPVTLPAGLAFEDPFDFFTPYPEDFTAPRMDPYGRLALPVGDYSGLYYENLILLWTPPATPPAVADANPAITTAGDDIRIDFSSMTGHAYQLTGVHELTQPFSPLLPPVSGTGGPMFLVHIGGATHGRYFYTIDIRPEFPPAQAE